MAALFTRTGDAALGAWLKRSEPSARLESQPTSLRVTDSSRNADIDLGQASPHFLTLGAGKAAGAVYEFLVSEAGFRPIARYEGSDLHEPAISGPRIVARDVLRILAATYCSTESDWVTASALSVSDSAAMALALQAWLPSPARGTMEDLARFRQDHEEELRQLRRHLRTELTIQSREGLEDALHDLSPVVAQPLGEVRRALELDSRLGLGWVRRQGLSIVQAERKGLLPAVLAGMATGPVLGNAFDVGGLAVGVVASTTVSVVTAILAGAEGRRHDRGLTAKAGPFAYVYDIGKEFGLEPG